MENTVSTGTSDIDTSGGDCVPSNNFHSGTGKIREKITNRLFNFSKAECGNTNASSTKFVSDMNMEIDDEGVKSNDESMPSNKLMSDETSESFEQNSSNTSLHNNSDRNGTLIYLIVFFVHFYNISISNKCIPYFRIRKCQWEKLDCSTTYSNKQGKICCRKWSGGFSR